MATATIIRVPRSNAQQYISPEANIICTKSSFSRTFARYDQRLIRIITLYLQPTTPASGRRRYWRPLIELPFLYPQLTENGSFALKTLKKSQLTLKSP